MLLWCTLYALCSRAMQEALHAPGEERMANKIIHAQRGHARKSRHAAAQMTPLRLRATSWEAGYVSHRPEACCMQRFRWRGNSTPKVPNPQVLGHLAPRYRKS